MAEITSTDRLARAGYLARAVVYGLLGYLAVTSAGRASDGPEGTLDFIDDIPGGDIVLGLVALGLVAYGLYKLATSLLDLDREGTGAAGIAKRIGSAAGAIAYLSLAYTAARMLTGRGRGGGGNTERAGDVLALPMGELLLGIGGLGFVLAAAAQVHSAWTLGFMRKLDPDAPPQTATIGRIGLAARSVVFAIVGWSLVQAALSENEGQVRDLGGVLRDLRDSGLLYQLVALGLIVFALYSLIEARYRIVPRVDMAAAARSKVARH